MINFTYRSGKIGSAETGNYYWRINTGGTKHFSHHNLPGIYMKRALLRAVSI